jgi:hypothetical protein
LPKLMLFIPAIHPIRPKLNTFSHNLFFKKKLYGIRQR